jgi:DNA-binding transcriptional ArsR family regulator
LGRNTDAYYAVLKETGQGQWNPGRSALPWVRFCLKAHYQQGVTLMRRNIHIGQVWEQIDKIIKTYELPKRTEAPLIDATFGYKVRNNKYRTEASISEVVASRDLKRLTEAGLLIAIGEKRGRTYEASDKLKAIATALRSQTPPIDDPYQKM